MTVSGEIAFERAVWQCSECRRSHAPVDLAMGVRSKGKWTVFIQDFWHVCERLAKLAQLLFPEAWEKTFEEWKKWLRTSKLGRLLRTLRSLHTQRRGKTREAVAQELGYVERGRHRMDYARYEKEGWLIGSGAVEGTCKHLIKSRFGVTGARWRRKNIHKILALRLAIFNNEWDQYWGDQYRENPKAA